MSIISKDSYDFLVDTNVFLYQNKFAALCMVNSYTDLAILIKLPR